MSAEDLGRVPVDSGRLLVVDPCHLPPELVARLTRPNEHGTTLAAIVGTPHGDGWYPVVGEPGALAILDPHHDYDSEPEDGDGGWKAATLPEGGAE
ncbi:hypothetical protein [Micromonospora avicenniae]|uniref:Uncharacterized protein n=1 Tax=Micromonospora avicenniae TaxID=1198245 RepID=A0A1N6YEJ0_9ACTN|nr:hypothetical protein [Micromonospora avicenniae]SIR12931.1 hypothetical protein SAMN05444858_106274 [Micromonospora avicenniae]